MNSSWPRSSVGIFQPRNLTNDTMREVTVEQPDFQIEGVTYMTLILIIACLGVLGNVMSFKLMSDKKLNSFAYSVYLKWVAVSDTVVIAVFTAEHLLASYEYLEIFITFHLAVCRIWDFIKTTSTNLSPWVIVALTVDRFVCIVFPLSRNRLCTKSKASKLCYILTFASMTLNVISLAYLNIKDGECEFTNNEHLYRYLVFHELVLRSFLPCFAILILNIVIISRIRRSLSFRKQFEISHSTASEEKKDKSTLSLLLVSIFAFVTLIPLAVTQATLMITDVAEFQAPSLASQLWPLFNLIFLLNFAQNFYIMIASSAQYRTIMKRKVVKVKVNGNVTSLSLRRSNTSSTQFSTSVVEIEASGPI